MTTTVIMEFPKRCSLQSMVLVLLCCICNLSVSSASSHSLFAGEDQLPNGVHGSITSIRTNKITNPGRRRLQVVNPPPSGLWKKLGDLYGERSRDEFGTSVAMSRNGSFIIVGTPKNDGNGLSSGHARVFYYRNQWIQVGSDIDGENALDSSGISVDINDNGDVVIIGANDNSGNGNRVGHARVYRNINGQWVQQGQDLDGEAANDRFGYSVAISGDSKRVIVGGIFNDSNGSQSGHVRIYEYNENSQMWVQLGKDIDGNVAYDLFGWDVDMSGNGDVVIIGARGFNTGRADIYQIIDGEWVQKGQTLNGEGLGDQFGYSVAISRDGKRVIVGAITNNGNGKVDSGHARIYKYDEDNQEWVQLGKDIDGDASYDQFGYSVDMSDDGDVVLVGIPFSESGTARIYRNIQGQWVQQERDLAGFGGSRERFGTSVAISGDGKRAIVGGPFNNGGGSYSGYVRVFEYQEITPQPTSIPTSKPTSKPSSTPSIAPSYAPTTKPSAAISSTPTNPPTEEMSDAPSTAPSYIPTTKPSITISIAPTNPPTTKTSDITTPSLRPSMKPPSNASSSCDDSPLMFMVQGISRCCKWVSRNPTERCNEMWAKGAGLDINIKSHCPKSCGACKEFGCSDTVGRFIVDDHEDRECCWLDSLSESHRDGLCSENRIYTTCQNSCGVCTQ